LKNEKREIELDLNDEEAVMREISAQRGLAQIRLFEAAYPDVDLGELFSNEEFISFIKETGDPLITAYEVFLASEGLEETEDSEDEAEQDEGESSPVFSTGSVRSSGKASQPSYFTRDEVMSMTRAQVRKNLDKIHKSIPRWKV